MGDISFKRPEPLRTCAIIVLVQEYLDEEGERVYHIEFDLGTKDKFMVHGSTNPIKHLGQAFTQASETLESEEWVERIFDPGEEKQDE